MNAPDGDRLLRTVLLYSAGHIGSAAIFKRMVDTSEYDVVAVVRSRPLRFTRKGVRRLKKHLRRMDWRFGWLICFNYIITNKEMANGNLYTKET